MADNLPLISVALCTYNGAKYLVEQLDSLLAQSYRNLEIIIVDDASTDATREIIEKYLPIDGRIRFFRNGENLGYNKNFEKAMSLAEGELIAFCDQDDIWGLQKLEVMAGHIGENRLLYHDSELIDENGASLGISTKSHHRFVRGRSEDKLLYNNCISAHACIFRRELLDDLPPLPEILYFDWWIAYTAACTGKLDYLDRKLVKHRIHPDSTTQNDQNDSRRLRVQQLAAFYNHPLTGSETRSLIATMLLGYKKTWGQKISFPLFFTLLAHYPRLFYVRKRSLFSRIKFILKESNIL